MTKKSLFKLIALITASACSAAAFSACEKECDHVYKWTVLTEATCSSEGVKEGVCGICGDVLPDVVIPIDPDNHAYGEWEITKPTDTQTGKAVKTCEYDPSHKHEVELPALSDEDKYTSVTVTTAPTQLEEGVKTYVLADDEGDVVFTVPVPARGIQTAGDAVEVGVAQKSQIRHAEGNISSYMSGNQPVVSTFSYEFGDNYTHIVDGRNNEELWCSLDENGEFFGYKQTSTGFISETESSFMDGACIRLGYTGYAADFYGAEDFLGRVYSWASENINKDFKEEVNTVDGETVYTFSFGYPNGQYLFSEITVNFTLTETYAIKSIDFTSLVYSNNFSDIADLQHETWVHDENGNCVVVDPDGLHYVDHVELTQTTLSELTEEERADVPENPYDKYAFFISSYDVIYNGMSVSESQPLLSITADKVYTLSISNIKPVSANPALDENFISVYYVNEKGAEIPLSAYTIDTITSVGILGFYTASEQTITIRSRIAGEITLRLKTERYTKDIKLNVTPIAPESLSPAVYFYDENTVDSHFWNTSATSATVYVGQPLYFIAKAPDNQLSYTNGNYLSSCGTADATLSEDEINGVEVTKFVADKSGSYVITMYSEANPSISCTLTVNVVAAPTPTGILSDTYTANVENPTRNTTISVTFKQSGEMQGTISIIVSDGTSENLSYAYDAATRTLTTSHLSGAELGYSITMNEAYKLIATHPTGFGNETESVVLSRGY